MSRWLLTADWHLRPETATTVFEAMKTIGSIVAAEKLAGVIQLGDLYHLRYALDVRLQNALVDALNAWNHPTILLPGNHDQYDTQGRNALEVLGHLPHVHVVNSPCWSTLGLFTRAHMFLPYRKNIAAYADTFKTPRKPGCTAFVHHGLVGARMNTHVVAGEKDGIPPAKFEGFQSVFLGHWHRYQVLQNCVYVGSPWQTRADEAGQPKGAVVWDSSTGTHEFVSFQIGRRFHTFAHGVPSDPKAGDQVRVPTSSKADPKLLQSYRDAGVEVWEEPEIKAAAPRLGLSAGASLRQQAEVFTASEAGDLDPKRLMLAFDFLTGATTS